jgi:D-methionine transport system ATP-binding protein
MIDFQNVCISFPAKGKNVEAVKNVSFTIKEKEIFGIVGTSGAGKSTLLRTINLLQRPTHGHVWIYGNNITKFKGDDLRILRTHIGMIFQQFNLINTKTVYDNVAFALKAKKYSKVEAGLKVLEMLQLVGLSDKSSAYPNELSGGQKQRVGIARALANNPKILLCDEPTSALDLETTNSILDLLKEVNTKLGITTVIISHEMNVIKKICDRVAVMSDGEVLELDTVFNIFTQPKHEFTIGLVNHTINLDLPSHLLYDKGHRLLKIVYSGKKAEEAVISDTAKKFNVHLNILHGKIEYITNKPFGVLIVHLDGAANDVAKAEKYLTERTFKVEVIND